MTKDTTPPWRVKFPEEDKLTRHLKTSLVTACYGNERIADVLDQLMCAASWEAKNKGMAEDQKVVRIKRTYPEILERLQFPTSRRSLNTYLHQLNEWGYVLSQPYQRDFDVHFENIQTAIDNPPAQPEKSCREGLQEKGGKCANLQPFHDGGKGGKVEDLQPFECEEKVCKCASLSTKVASLHKKVETLSTNVASLATFQTRLEALEKLVQDHFFGATDITGNTTNITGNNVVASHNAFTFTLLTEDDFQDIEEKMAKSSLPHQNNVQNATSLSIDPTKGSASPTPAGRIASTIVEQGDIHAVTSRDIDASRYPADLRHSDNIHPHSVLGDHTKVELSSTVVDEENHSDATNTMAPDHNASSEPANRQKTGIVESQPVKTPPTQDKPPVGEYSASEMPSSTQAVKDLSNQATEQGKQVSGDDLIATSATNNQPAENPPATKKPRGGKKETQPKPEKPQLSDEEKAKEAQYAERRRFWQNKINERRGGPLRTGGLCINETECLNTLVREFDDIDIGKIDRYLATTHWKYKKNPAEIGGKALLDESRPALQYLKTKGGQARSTSSQQTPTPIKAYMTREEAGQLAHDAIAQAKQHGYDIQAQVVSSTKIEGAWFVKVKWENVRNIPVPLIKTRKQWQEEFQSIHEVLNLQLTPAAERQAK